jgi:hypothetical protein
MSLDLSKLESVKPGRDKTTARCPACAEKGDDHSHDHLIIYPDGRFGCVAHPKDGAHNKAIFRLVGVKDGNSAERGPIPVPIRRPSYAQRKSRTLRTLDSNLLAFLEKEEDTEAKRTTKHPSAPSEPPGAASFMEQWQLIEHLIPVMDALYQRDEVQQPLTLEQLNSPEAKCIFNRLPAQLSEQDLY